MKKEIQRLINDAIKSTFGIDFDLEKIKIDYPPEGMGDFSANVALLLAKQVGKSPMEVAEKLADFFRRPTSKISVDVGRLQIEKVEVAKPGFLNFYLADKLLPYMVVKINKEKEKYGNSDLGQGKKVHLDFVSANPTGPVHVGNARGGPLGDTLANVFQKAGYEPFREYYVNDAGNQVEILGHSILGDEKAEYGGDYVADIKNQIGHTIPFAKGKSLTNIKNKDATNVGA